MFQTCKDFTTDALALGNDKVAHTISILEELNVILLRLVLVIQDNRTADDITRSKAFTAPGIWSL
jgi:hypothetical protein